jgi:hypothetical protein
MTFRESYLLIVLRDGNADHMGKGRTGLRSSQRKLCPDNVKPVNRANLTAKNSKIVSVFGYGALKRVTLRNLVL